MCCTTTGCWKYSSLHCCSLLIYLPSCVYFFGHCPNSSSITAISCSRCEIGFPRLWNNLFSCTANVIFLNSKLFIIFSCRKKFKMFEIYLGISDKCPKFYSEKINPVAKLPQPGYSKVTFAVFKSSCHLLLPV